MNIGIYKITTPSEYVYIGQSWNIKSRFRYYKTRNKNTSQTALFNSLRKYGVDSHSFEIIHSLPVDVTQDVLDLYESIYITFYKNCGIKLLNIREGGSRGKWSKEGREKLTKIDRPWLFERRHSEEHKQMMSNLMSGRIVSDETKEKLRLINTGKKQKQESIEKMRLARTGVPRKSETLEKMSLNSPSRREILQYSLSGELIKEWFSLSEIRKSLKIDRDYVTKCCKGDRENYKNYIWKYKH